MAMITVPALNDIEGLRHAFFTREGGVSSGIFASANCGLGSGDEVDCVLTNRARAMEQIDRDGKSLVTLYQVHSARAVVVDDPWPREHAPQADAMVTTRPGVALGILTADCAPVLFADRQARVIGAAHAGWRGALTGVLDGAIAEMVRLGARVDRIVAAIGPCIAQPSYEVGPEFPAPFLAADPGSAAFFLAAPKSGHFLFDLGGYVGATLTKLGIRQVAHARHDTCREEERFFSYRRACLRGERDYGRLLSAIALPS
jgi:polyphenol oxidase